MPSDPLRPVLNRAAEPIGEDIFRKYQAYPQPDQKSHDKSAHNRSPQQTRHTGGAPTLTAIGPRQIGKIMV